MTKKTPVAVVVFLFIGLALAPAINADIGILSKREPTSISNGNHPPIYIDGNDEFTPENGVTGGNGIENDPYIIEDWVIVGDGSISEGIFINSTNAFFVIRNCSVSNFFSPNDFCFGIKFANVENGKIENTNSFENYIAIGVRYSTHIQIDNCSGFDGYDAPSNFLSKGISCYYSTYITITSSECYNVDIGIYIDEASDVVIENSECYNTTWAGIECEGSDWQLMRIAIKDCTVHDNEFQGITLHYWGDIFNRMHPSYSYISGCEIYNNVNSSYPALNIQCISDNIIENCIIHDNNEGFYIDTGNNIIRNCSFFNINGTGLTIAGGFLFPFDIARKNKVLNCNIYNNSLGIGLIGSINTQVEKNNIINNSILGMMTFNVFFTKFNYNNIVNNGYASLNGTGGIFSWFSFVNVRNNWWNSSDGPSGVGPGNGDSLNRRFSIALFRPWATEPIPDAGVQ
ncbi:MAG: right-handed parallel beta-helix repeat-containing protein [Thermoplasmatales archaeon]|nr:right-handed parallel beta-helix repeat-containing protein [Thermoplasmatales archaeon]